MSENSEQVCKADLLTNIRTERQLLEECLAGLAEHQIIQPGVVGDWSVKDILAHFVAWEQRMIGWVGEYLGDGTPDVPQNWDDIHQLNAQSYQESRDRPLAGIFAEFQASYRQALSLAENTSEADLIDPNRFPSRGGQPLWIMVAANTWWHYREHRQEIEAWLDRS